MEDSMVQMIDPEKIRLVPGQSVQGIFASRPEGARDVGLFIRGLPGVEFQDRDLGIEQRAGLVRFDDVLLVVTMIKITRTNEEIFDVWWNYHAPEGLAQFKRMSEQEILTVHFYNEKGKRFSIDTENGFRKFFSDLQTLIARTKPWTEVEFDRAVRSFCAQSYPKENLWEMIELGSSLKDSIQAQPPGLDTYPGIIPAELHPFYEYTPEKGHCIRVIPSILEGEATSGNPEEYLHAAPVKTVLRCGIRWTRGYPVVPVPFIPGHGLAVPPDDAEF
jgi:hypothetical protein